MWSKIFSKKIDTDKVRYTSDNAIMMSRHYYSAIFLNDFLKKKNFSICDYGTGEANFGLELLKINKKVQFNFTEHNKILFQSSKKKVHLGRRSTF